MLKLYYSNKDPEATLVDTSSSLGGYISLNLIQNSKLNSLFGDSYLTEEQETRLIILKNESSSQISISLIEIEVVSESISFNYKVGLASPSLDSCSREKYEIIEEGSVPFYCQFFDSINPTEPIVLAEGKTIGLWVMRELIQSEESTSMKGNLSCEELTDSINLEIFRDKKETLSIDISYD